MTLQQIYYAITVSEAGSINKAAEKLIISQPSLTGAIKELERYAGISIFLRTSKGHLKPHGGVERFYDYMSYYKDRRFVSIIVARTADKDNPVYKRVVEAYQSEGIAKTLREDLAGSSLPAWQE